jgi:hypothetical protein
MNAPTTSTVGGEPVTPEEIYRHFMRLPGSQHIATSDAIEGLGRVLSVYRPRTVLV